MKNKGMIRNICMDFLLHTILILRLFDTQNVILNNACKFLPLLFSFLCVVSIFAILSFTTASLEPVLKAKILNDKSLIDGFIKSENNKKLRIYHKTTNLTLSILLILNGFIGCLGIWLIALLLLNFSKQALRLLINLPPKPDPQAFKKFKQKLLSETSVN